jgi:hypothetical protein
VNLPKLFTREFYLLIFTKVYFAFGQIVAFVIVFDIIYCLQLCRHQQLEWQIFFGGFN